MATFLLRVELPDRPGALGAVASRIGALRADVVAVDIVGRGDGRAVDEFVVELADENHVSLLLSEVAEVDGVQVEEVRVLPAIGDRRLDAYDTANALLQQRTPHGVLAVVAERARVEMDGLWACVFDPTEKVALASEGKAPAAQWLAAYIEGTRWHASSSGKGIASEVSSRSGSRGLSTAEGAGLPNVHAPASDVAWVDLAVWDLVLAVGRPGRSFGEHDRLRLAALARLADARWIDLAERDARLSHPSGVG